MSMSKRSNVVERDLREHIHRVATTPPATRGPSWACYWKPGDEDPDPCAELARLLAAELAGGMDPYVRGYARGWDAALEDAATDPHRNGGSSDG